MALAFNNDCILPHGCNMVSGLLQTYITCPDYLMVQSWVFATFLFPNTVNKMVPQVYHNVVLFLDKMDYMLHCTPCHCTMGIVDHSNAEMPFVITTFLAL